MRRTALILPPLALLAWAALPVPEAAAQLRGGGQAAPNAPRPPPPGLPGLQYQHAPEPIPADPNQNLSPNAALFDAINRGDLAAARDAVGRGADVEARNVLGLTPVDAAVDQRRNEIMFYLLSVRAGSRSASPPLDAATTAAATPAPGPAPRPAPRRTTAPPRAAAAEVEGMPPGPAQQAANPRLWAGDGGAPIPEIGFLGFDAGRPAGAVPPSPAPRAPSRRAGRG